MHFEASHTHISRDATGHLRYPVESRIPVDILELIFEAGVRNAQRQSSALLPLQKPIEIAVSQVNRRWREASVNLAVLWSFIRASSIEALDKLEMYFERSKNHALSVSLFAYKAYWRSDMLAKMRPHLHRVRQFHLITDFIHSPPMICRFHSPAAATPLLPFTGGSPLLTSIRLNGPMFDLIRPPFSGISQLYLRSCVSLVKFSFIGHSQRPHRRLATSLDVVPFALPELLFLQLSQNSKFPVLESLSFFDNTFSINEYHDIARIFPAIRAFSCLNSSYTDEVLEFLVPLPTSSSVTHMPWPNIGSLSFSQAQFHEKHQAMLCSLVSARIALRAPILNLFLGHANRLLLDTDRLDWLRERLRMQLLAEFSSDEGHHSW
ncbi:hypothetical protein B0H13DRAFT_2041867 [Mycena leptocephala]|nr:hypothetical protein B0H13DRAFT_2041867 [Mycena leptocephala]